MTSTPSISANQASNGVELRRLWWLGPATIAATVVANLITLLIIQPLSGISGADFMPFTVGPIAIFTALQVGIGVIVFAVIARFSKQPIRLFSIIAWVALVLSCIPNVALGLNPANAPFPNAPGAGFFWLIAFHVVAGVLTIWMLTNLSRAK